MEDATSQSFKNSKETVNDLKFYSDMYVLNEAEWNSLACIFFINHWLDRHHPDLMEIDARQWIVEERPKALAEFGSKVWVAGNTSKKMSDVDWVVIIDLTEHTDAGAGRI